ncbi:MAG: hypothetical protein K0Q63_2212 [Paenibacillus sp.]|jgi:hypothetical protein|nr:hypothetical protein [Paenibacillus sp.]
MTGAAILQEMAAPVYFDEWEAPFPFILFTRGSMLKKNPFHFLAASC